MIHKFLTQIGLYKTIVMNRIVIAFAFVLGLTSFVSAQELSKEEKKEWASKLKSMTPENFKKLVENKDQYKSDAESLQGEVEQLQADNDQLQSEVGDYKAAAQAAEEKAAQMEAAASAPQTASADASASGAGYDNYESPTSKGVLFKVQVGAFKNFDITKYFERHQNFSGEVDADGTMKYTLGVFSEYWEADKFKKYMREMGVKGAWIVSYKDGKRVNIKDVLEGAL